MKPKSIGVIIDAFKEKHRISELEDDPELQYLYRELIEKKSIYGIHWNYEPQNDMLSLLQTHLPELFPPAG